jgi:aminopeptidase N
MPKTLYLKDYRPADFQINSVHLHVDLHEENTVVKTVLDIKRNPAAKTPQAPLVLNGEDMSLRSVSIDGKPLSADQYQVDAEHLSIANVPDAFILETEVVIQAQKNTRLSGLYKSRTNFCTQCEANGFRRITYYLDRPDVMSRFTTTITADKKLYPILLSNGNLIERKDLSDGRHWVHWEDPSLKPAYLFELVAGDFDILEDNFKTQSGRNVELKLYLEKGFRDQGDFALTALKHAMQWDEATFGREYDLDIYMIVAVSDFNMGAMENKGLNIFNTKYILAKPETATDQDYAAIESVIGHEYFHNWSGNRVTCRDWFQITLKEGLTVLREQLFSAAMTSPAVARIDEVNQLRNRQFLEDDGPNAHPVRPESYIEVNNFYTATVYSKGAEVIRMVRTLLGPELFRKGMDLYFSRHDGQAVTTEDFIQAMADASGRDFSQFLRWYRQSGTPRLEVRGKYDAGHESFTLTVKQSCPPTPGQPQKEPFYLPLAMGLVGQDGQDLPLQLQGETETLAGTKVLVIRDSQQEFVFTHVSQKPAPSLLRNFSAPVKLDYPYTLEELALLMAHDSDTVARWEASQQFAVKHLLDWAAKLQKRETLPPADLWTKTFSQLLADKSIDLHLLTRLFTLPTESYLAQYQEPVDVENIHQAREFAKQLLATGLERQLLATYHHLLDTKPYTYNTAAMGRRSVKNLALAYLVNTTQEKYADLAVEQFRASDNMTDTMGALWALNNYPGAARQQVLADFYKKWQDQPLVVNKWLALQASSQLPDTLAQVEKLLKHPAFSIDNPNNVYNLIVVLAGNTIHFHAADGSGYQFIADRVIEIDPKNPQVAARVVEPLTRWQRFDKRRQEMMRTQLQRVQANPKISNDVYELVSKSLQN